MASKSEKVLRPSRIVVQVHADVVERKGGKKVAEWTSEPSVVFDYEALARLAESLPAQLEAIDPDAAAPPPG